MVLYQGVLNPHNMSSQPIWIMALCQGVASHCKLVFQPTKCPCLCGTIQPTPSTRRFTLQSLWQWLVRDHCHRQSVLVFHTTLKTSSMFQDHATSQSAVLQDPRSPISSKEQILWQWEDDNGKVHEHTIPNSYYIPEVGLRLLSPQHWMQASSKFQGSCTIFCNHAILKWDTFQQTVPAMWSPSQWLLATPTSSPSVQWQGWREQMHSPSATPGWQWSSYQTNGSRTRPTQETSWI